jgi:hypothetical protein
MIFGAKLEPVERQIFPSQNLNFYGGFAKTPIFNFS